MAAFPGLHHVALTVSDLGVSRPWYQKLFGADPVMDEDTGPFHHVVWLVGDGQVFGIHQHSKPSSNEPVDERRPGIDHVSFGCKDRDELKEWQSNLESLGIKHGGVVEAPYGAGLSFRDPDNNPLEFFVLGGAS
jgi:catechol 2,3-dioxygenase-like lactoylglutathione lyase family enzyme